MRFMRTALGLMLATAATAGALFATGAPADAATLIISGSLTNTANSAKGTASVYLVGSEFLYVNVTAYDIKADGYAARAQVSVVNRDGTTEIVSSIAVADGGNGTSKTVMSPYDDYPETADYVKLLVWNGPNGPVVTKNIDLPL